MRDDPGHVGQRLHVVHHRRRLVQPSHGRKRRLVARIPFAALERVEKARLLATHVGAGPAMNEDVAGKRAAENSLAHEPRGAGLLQRALQSTQRQVELAAYIDECVPDVQRVGGDQHSFDELMRSVLEDPATGYETEPSRGHRHGRIDVETVPVMSATVAGGTGTKTSSTPSPVSVIWSELMARVSTPSRAPRSTVLIPRFSGAQPFAVDMNSAAKSISDPDLDIASAASNPGCPEPPTSLAYSVRVIGNPSTSGRSDPPSRPESSCPGTRLGPADVIIGVRLDHRGRIGTGEAAPGSRSEAGDAYQRHEAEAVSLFKDGGSGGGGGGGGCCRVDYENEVHRFAGGDSTRRLPW